MIQISSIPISDIEREYARLRRSGRPGGGVKIALLSSFTLVGLESSLAFGAHRLGLAPEIFVGGYNQYAQELLDPDGAFWQFAPDITVLLLDAATLLGPCYADFSAAEPKTKKGWQDEIANTFLQLAASVNASGRTTLLVGNILFPPYSPYGLLDPGLPDGMAAFSAGLDAQLAEGMQGLQNVILFDAKSAVAEYGWRNAFDPRLYFLGRILLRPDFMPLLAERLLGFIAAKTGLKKKCLVVDLDDTLWGGVLGEDGPNGILLGETAPGNAYLRVQQIVRDLGRRGIILAICSKNNEADFREVFEKRPDMPLSLDDFAAWRVNWNEKASNIRELAEEINIGLDSLVFLDDSPIEREWVRASISEVVVLDPPEDIALWPEMLRTLPWFESLAHTEEDAQRGKLYQQQKKRVEHKKQFASLDDFLKSLKIAIEIKPLDEATLQRAAQLTQRTNQFNLCVRRCSVEDVDRAAGDGSRDAISVRVSDRFGDYGVVGLIMGQDAGDGVYEIDNFLLSCRALGRKAEEAMFGEVVALAKKRGCERVLAASVETKKNRPARDFFEKCGATPKPDGFWEFSVDCAIPALPGHIKITRG